jgi:hypothetical protein
MCELPYGQAVSLSVCLLCGEYVCTPGSSARISSCLLSHVARCDGIDGMFLDIQRCTVLLMHNDRLAIWGSLYLDAHGEEDLCMRRGKELYLNKKRVDKLAQCYLRVGVLNTILALQNED